MKPSCLRRAAVTLVELTLVLAIAAIAIFGAVKAYSLSRENALYQQTTQAVGTIRAAVASRYGMTSDYTNLGADKLISTLPQSMVRSDNTLVNPFMGTTEVGADTATTLGDTFYISLTNLTSDACNRLARADLGREAFAVRVDATNAAGPVNHVAAYPMSGSSLDTALAACASTEKSSVSIQFGAAASSASSGSGGSGGSGSGGSGSGGGNLAACTGASSGNCALFTTTLTQAQITSALADFQSTPVSCGVGDGVTSDNLEVCQGAYLNGAAGTSAEISHLSTSMMKILTEVMLAAGDNPAATPPTKNQMDIAFASQSAIINQYVGGAYWGNPASPTDASNMISELKTLYTNLGANLTAGHAPGW